MQEIIAPVDKSLLMAELVPERKLRDTNKGNNEIYIVSGRDCPNVLREIGRLREIAFRASGGGSGLPADIDEFDTMEVPYRQLIVWDPDAGAILGGYRFILGSEMIFDDGGQPVLATSHMFRFSKKFIEDYLPYTIELGRSFVSPEYQSSKAGAKALFALDNLWDGLAALMIIKPGMKYFFGKMTMYPSYDRYGRDLILYFLDKHFGDKEKLVVPYSPVKIGTDTEKLDAVLSDADFKSDYRNLNAEIRRLGINIPPLVNSYMNISPTMKMFGTAVNEEFSDVEETGILIDFDEMFEEKKSRHIDSYVKMKMKEIRERFPSLVEKMGDRLSNLLLERRNRIQAAIEVRRNNSLFDEVVQRKGSGAVKYDSEVEVFGRGDLIPMWVADMDFRTPKFIIDALKSRLEHPVLGYTEIPKDYFDTIASWIGRLYQWTVEKDDIRYIPGIVKGIGLVLNAFLEKGDKVIIQPPVYHPFRLVPERNGFEVVCNPLVPLYMQNSVGGTHIRNGRPEDMSGKDRDAVLVGYEMDFEQLESIIDERTKVLILSNPHNPAGISWSRETLARLAEITSRHGIIVISDEIHAEMTHNSASHVPYAMVSEAAASNSVTFMAPSKTFNIAGVVSSYSIVLDPGLRKRFYDYLEANEFDSPNIFSAIAAVAAYKYGWEWRKQMLAYVWDNICYVDEFLKENIPQIRCLKPQASFLIWLDCRSLGLPQEELVRFFCESAHLGLNDGAMFGKEGKGFMRLNAGCPRSVLKKAMEQLKDACDAMCGIPAEHFRIS